jgi:hypothetical protein
MIQDLVRRFAPRTARERRALRIGAVAVALWLAVQGVVRPYWNSLGELRGRLDRERELLGREATLLAQSAAFTTRYAAIERATLGEAPRLFAGADFMAATGSLGAYVGGQAAAHRVMVQQSEGRPPEDTGSGMAALRLDIKAVSDLEGLAGLLYALEHGPKLVRVDQFLVTPAAPAAPGDEPALALVASVRAYAFADSSARP